jgi:hypothetical protein
MSNQEIEQLMLCNPACSLFPVDLQQYGGEMHMHGQIVRVNASLSDTAKMLLF